MGNIDERMENAVAKSDKEFQCLLDNAVIADETGCWQGEDPAGRSNGQQNASIRTNFESVIHQMVEEKLRLLTKRYNVDKESLESLRNFLMVKTRQYNMRIQGRKIDTSYNMILECTDRDLGEAFCQDLGRAIRCFGTTHIHMKGYCTEGDTDCVGDIGSELMLIIDQCIPKPFMDQNDENYDSNKAMKNLIDRYQRLWEITIENAEENPNQTMVIVANSSICHHSLKADKKLYDYIFPVHVKLNPYTAKQIATQCYILLNKERICGIDASFREALQQYVEETYEDGETSSKEYIQRLIMEIKRNTLLDYPQGCFFKRDNLPVVSYKKRSPEEVLALFDDYVGFEGIKKELEKMYRAFLLKQQNQQKTSKKESQVKTAYHMIFKGAPGTGKTTVAERIGEFTFAAGITKTDQVVKANAHDFTSMWKGGNVEKLSRLVESAMGGVLFLDEAYAMCPGEQDKGKETALAYLLSVAEDRADEIVIILAGYPEEMEELIRFNPGMKSRFERELIFPDMDVDSLEKIFYRFCEKDGFQVSKDARELLVDCIAYKRSGSDFANARSIRNLYQEVLEEKSMSGQQDCILRNEDFAKVLPEKKSGIKEMVGLENVKKQLALFKNTVLYKKRMMKDGALKELEFNLNMSFEGNPGTGKTTVAERIADEFYNAGILRTNKLTVLERKDLVGSHQGDTEQKVAKVLKRAFGGVIFIDEAYALARGGDNDYGQLVIDELLKAMLEHREDTIFIFAGYTQEMQEFWDANPGLYSRVPNHFSFEDYTEEELSTMFVKLLEKNGLKPAPSVKRQIAEVILYFMPMSHFGNGRFVELLVQKTVEKRAERFCLEGNRSDNSCTDSDRVSATRKRRNKSLNDITKKDLPTVKELMDMMANGGDLYDPEELDQESHRRTAIHEMGHAVSMLIGGELPEKISIINQIGSLGRVTYKPKHNKTEEECFGYIVTLLSGKNAEELLLGNHSVGCSSDYAKAKRMAEDMVKRYAMEKYGSKKEILKAAEERSMEILREHQDYILKKAEELLGGKAFTGKELKDDMEKDIKIGGKIA